MYVARTSATTAFVVKNGRSFLRRFSLSSVCGPRLGARRGDFAFDDASSTRVEAWRPPSTRVEAIPRRLRYVEASEGLVGDDRGVVRVVEVHEFPDVGPHDVVEVVAVLPQGHLLAERAEPARLVALAGRLPHEEVPGLLHVIEAGVDALEPASRKVPGILWRSSVFRCRRAFLDAGWRLTPQPRVKRPPSRLREAAALRLTPT